MTDSGGSIEYIDDNRVHVNIILKASDKQLERQELIDIKIAWENEDVASVPMKIIFQLLMFIAWRMVK